MKYNGFWCGVLLLALLASGCGAPTEIDRDNRRVLDAILTAVTLKNPRLLEDDARRAKERYQAGQLSDGDYRALEAIISKARAGDWGGAETDGYAFRKRRPFVKEGQ
jgi:hypothetical protein